MSPYLCVQLVCSVCATGAAPAEWGPLDCFDRQLGARQLTQPPGKCWALPVALDEQLMDRVRRTLAGEPDIAEKRMVGGRSFSRAGRMFCGVTGGGLMVRVGRAGMTAALAEPHVAPMMMGSKPTAGFVVVAGAGVSGDQALALWIHRGLAAVDPDVAEPPTATRSPSDRFDQLVDYFADEPGVTGPTTDGGHRFGSTALKVNGSIFAMLTGGQLVVKLPARRVIELIEAGIGQSFAAGKAAPMKEWLAVVPDDPAVWREMATEALEFGKPGPGRQAMGPK